MDVSGDTSSLCMVDRDNCVPSNPVGHAVSNRPDGIGADMPRASSLDYSNTTDERPTVPTTSPHSAERAVSGVTHLQSPAWEMAVLTEGLTKTFGAITAVEGLTLRIRTGEVFGLLGPRGAGKTTVLRMLAGQLKPSSGVAVINGLDVFNPTDAHQVRAQTAYVSQRSADRGEMSTAEMAHYFNRLLRLLDDAHTERVGHILDILELAVPGARDSGERDAGTRCRFALARALVHNPDVVFLDEMTAHLTPDEDDMVNKLVRFLTAINCTVVLATQQPEQIERHCDRVAYLQGRALMVCKPGELHPSMLGRL